jgi:hypothetical protein
MLAKKTGVFFHQSPDEAVLGALALAVAGLVEFFVASLT